MKKSVALVLILSVAGGAAWMSRERPGMDRVETHLAPTAPAGASGLTATWFGTAGVLLSDGEYSLLVDPFFTRPDGWLRMLGNRRIAPDAATIARWLKPAPLGHLEAVLVSHSHHDHAMDAGWIAAQTRAALIGSESTANIGRGAGVGEYQIRVPAPGKPIALRRFTVTFFDSAHAGATGGFPGGDIAEPLKTPARYTDYKQGGTYSILVEHPLGRVLLHGSAGFVPDMLKGQKADVVFLGIALLGELEPYLHETVDAVGAARVFPTHWDDFTRPLDQPLRPSPVGVDLTRFFDEMARLRPAVRVETLKLAEPMLLFAGAAPRTSK